MPGGFLPSPEKDYVQATLFLPAIREAYERSGEPLSMLCLPGRACRFLARLLTGGYTTLPNVVCVERDPTEALFIRGRLAAFSEGSGRVTVNVVPRTVYEYLSDHESDAVSRRLRVVDLDIYGTAGGPDDALLQAAGAAIDVQSRANMREWLLLLTFEIASKRTPGLLENLRGADQRMGREEGDVLRQALPPSMLQDGSATGSVRRVMGGVAAMIAGAAIPGFVADVRGKPLVYRGTDDYGDRRALMGAMAIRMRRPDRPITGLRKQRRDELIGESTNAAAQRGAACRGVLNRLPDGVPTRTDDLIAVVGT